jgi:hypothetical protein
MWRCARRGVDCCHRDPVRNPTFALTFNHPNAVRAGETDTLFVTIHNTSSVDANLVSLSPRRAGEPRGHRLLRDEAGRVSETPRALPR